MSFRSHAYDRAVVRWLDAVIVAVVLMVIIGGITRLTESGLSMTDWKLIGEVVPPMSEEAWQAKFAEYQGTPQHQIINPDMTVDEFKGIFWWEYIHRMWGRGLGILVGLPFLYFALSKRLSPRSVKLLAVAFTLGAAQGLLGWFMVQSGLIDRPWVSPVRLTAHFILAVTLLGLLTWIRMEIRQPQQTARPSLPQPVPGWLRWGLPILAGVLLLQFCFGGVMAGLKAAMDYPSFPQMNGQWIPSGLWRHGFTWLNFTENSTLVHFVHRSLGTVALLLASWVGWQAMRTMPKGRWRTVFHLLAVATWLQFILGIATVLHARGGVPLLWGSLHQIGAVALAILLTLCFFYRHGNRIS